MKKDTWFWDAFREYCMLFIPFIALRVSISTLEKAKATGKGYTGFLSRLLDNAIDDPQMVAKSM